MVSPIHLGEIKTFASLRRKTKRLEEALSSNIYIFGGDDIFAGSPGIKDPRPRQISRRKKKKKKCTLEDEMSSIIFRGFRRTILLSLYNGLKSLERVKSIWLEEANGWSMQLTAG